MRDILVTAIVFGVLPFIFKRPWIGILLWCWLGYMNPHRQTWGFAYDFPFAFICAIVTIMAFLFSQEKKEMVWTRETVLLLMFIGWMFITTFFAFYPESGLAPVEQGLENPAHGLSHGHDHQGTPAPALDDLGHRAVTGLLRRQRAAYSPSSMAGSSGCRGHPAPSLAATTKWRWCWRC